MFWLGSYGCEIECLVKYIFLVIVEPIIILFLKKIILTRIELRQIIHTGGYNLKFSFITIFIYFNPFCCPMFGVKSSPRICNISSRTFFCTSLQKKLNMMI